MRLPAILRPLGCFLLTVLASGLGCSGGPKTTTLNGTVTYKGAPVTMGAIYFHGPDNRVAMGNITEDGHFTATDVPLGEVRVSLQVRDPGAYNQQMQGTAANPTPKPGSGHSTVTRIPPKYADPNTSGLQYPIDATTKQIEVKLD
jgi:hypothetical protein